MLNDTNWQQREDQKSPLVCLRDSDLKIGAYYIYRGKTAITPATYLARVEKITRWLVVLQVTIDQSTDFEDEAKMGRPASYCTAIRRVDIGRTERLYRRLV